jgi:UDP-glucuronate 4-epimerase
MTILVTGAAGFIGMHVTARLLADGHEVLGLDNLNDYYDVRLKAARLAQLTARKGFTFEKIDLADDAAIAALFKRQAVERGIHLGAPAGVR